MDGVTIDPPAKPTAAHSAAFYAGVKACEQWLKDERLGEHHNDAIKRLTPFDPMSREGGDWTEGFTSRYELHGFEEFADTTGATTAEVEEFCAEPVTGDVNEELLELLHLEPKDIADIKHAERLANDDAEIIREWDGGE